jgi:hypothetical protein
MLLVLLLIASLLVKTTALLKISDYNRNFTGPPEVFLIGSPKAGTSSLAALLSESHGLHLFEESGGRKEPEFFSTHFNDESFTEYITGYQGKKPGFDGSTESFATKWVPDRIYRLYSPESLRKKKFILLLRDPTARRLSQYHMWLGLCREALAEGKGMFI